MELNYLRADARLAPIEQRYNQAFALRKQAAEQYLSADRSGDKPARSQSIRQFQNAEHELNDAHAAGEKLVGKDFHDTNYIFLSFVTRYLPAGLVGLIIPVIFGRHVVHVERD